MTTEYQSFPGRVVSAITDVRNSRVRVSIDIDQRDWKYDDSLERCVIDGTVVDVVVSKEVK